MPDLNMINNANKTSENMPNNLSENNFESQEKQLQQNVEPQNIVPETPTSNINDEFDDVDPNTLAQSRNEVYGVGNQLSQKVEMTNIKPVAQPMSEQQLAVNNNQVAPERVPENNVRSEQEQNVQPAQPGAGQQTDAIKVETAAATSVPVSPAVPKEEKKGFLAWLFGGSKKEEPKAPHEQEEKIGENFFNNSESQPTKKE